MKNNILVAMMLCVLQVLIASNALALSKPVLLTPSNGSTAYVRNATFTWSTVTGAYSYDVQVATDTNFTNLIAYRQGLYITRFVPVNAMPYTTLYWRVKAKDTLGTDSSAWSSRFSYILAAPSKTYTIPAGASLKAIKDTMRKAIMNTPATLAFTANETYYLDGVIAGQFAIDTANVNDLIIEGNNATLIIKNHLNVGFMRIKNSNRVTVRRLKVDWDPLPHSLLDVIKVNNSDSNTLNVNVRLRSIAGQSSPFYPRIDDPIFKTYWSWSYLIDTSDRGSLKKIPLNVFGIGSDDVTALVCKDTPVYNIYHPGSKAGKYFAVGDVLSIVCRNGVGSFMSTTNCTDMTFDSVINYASPIGCYYSYEGSDMKVLNCQAALKDATRFVSANADGVHCRANAVGPWIENSSFVGNADDGVALYNKGIFVKSKVNDTSLVVLNTYMNLQKGHVFRIFTPKTGKIISTTFTVDTVIAQGADYRVKFTPAIPAADYSTMVDVGNADLQQNVQLYNATIRNEKFMVYNSRFTVRGRGSVIRAAKGMVYGNKYYSCSSPAVAFYNEAEEWTNGLYSRDIWVMNNDIKTCGFDNLGDDAGAINIRINAIDSIGINSFKDTMSLYSKDHANIFIENNTIKNFAQHGISLFNGANCKIANNIFTSDTGTFLRSGLHYGIYINTTFGISILNNNFSGDTRTPKTNIQHVNDTSTTIVP